MKKIAVFLPDLRGGGAEKVALLLANEFVQLGFSVDVVLSNSKGELLHALDGRITVVDLKSTRVRHVLFPLLRYLKNERPDALLALMWPLTLLAVIAFKMARLTGKVVISDHTTFSQAPLLNSRLRRCFFKCSLPLVYPLANVRLAVSKGVAEDLESLGKLKRESVDVIYNPVLPIFDFFSEQKLKEAWKNFNGKKIVVVGALKWAKDYPNLLKAFALLLPKQNAMLSIVGQGGLLEELEKLAGELSISGNVQFVGFSDEPSAWMESADLLVLSSHYEGFGNVLVEAMSVGTPVVSTDCKSGPREILEDGKYGKLVPVGDAEALAQAIFESLNEEHDTEALKRRAADFTVDKIAAQYLDVMLPERLKKND
jgi:glycosyltransferase involved in cell wall biosynthesis